MMQGVEAFHREISSKGYRYMRPGLETTPWAMRETGVIDPFGNLFGPTLVYTGTWAEN
jgi:hypothetical protein